MYVHVAINIDCSFDSTILQAPMMDNMIERITADLNCCEHKKKETGRFYSLLCNLLIHI